MKTHQANTSNTFKLNTASVNRDRHFQRASAPPTLRSSLKNHDSYYRSLIITSETGINPLMTACSGLIVIIGRLKRTASYKNINQLYERLVHEVRVFETKAQKLEYRSEAILVARYLLCATIDETIMKTSWGQKNDWQQRLLNTFQREDNAGERFFVILERISEEPAHHIDLLELIYICLRLGFEGKYQQQETTKLEDITDALFQRIRKQRQELKPLSMPLPIKMQTTKVKKIHPYVIQTSIISLFLIVAAFIFTMFSLGHLTSKIVAHLETISTNLDQHYIL
ncbi:MAG: type IVB secretion system protein IcmH/DotU [Gammaproteobacteria bacterium]